MLKMLDFSSIMLVQRNLAISLVLLGKWANANLSFSVCYFTCRVWIHTPLKEAVYQYQEGQTERC